MSEDTYLGMLEGVHRVVGKAEVVPWEEPLEVVAAEEPGSVWQVV